MVHSMRRPIDERLNRRPQAAEKFDNFSIEMNLEFIIYSD